MLHAILLSAVVSVRALVGDQFSADKAGTELNWCQRFMCQYVLLVLSYGHVYFFRCTNQVFCGAALYEVARS